MSLTRFAVLAVAAAFVAGGDMPSASARTASRVSTPSDGAEVPAPGALWLFAAGLAGIGLHYGRRRR